MGAWRGRVAVAAQSWALKAMLLGVAALAVCSFAGTAARLLYTHQMIHHTVGNAAVEVLPDANLAAGATDFVLESEEGEPAFAELLPAAVHTPYHLTPGGGERVVLTMVRMLQQITGETVDLWVEQSNVCKKPSCVQSVAQLLDVKLDFTKLRVKVVDIDGALRKQYVLWVHMANSLMPGVPSHGLFSVYHCQFPFDGARDERPPQHLWQYLESYDTVYLNSHYTLSHYNSYLRRELQHHTYRPCLPRVTHFPPPLTLLEDRVSRQSFHTKRGRNIIIVGRIFDELQGKKQMEAIRAYRLLRQKEPHVKLYIVGSIVTGQEQYVTNVAKAAARTPGVELLTNAKKDVLIDLMLDCLVVWSITGMGRPANEQPADAEHFGLALVEAMSTGLVPVVMNKGGPVEIVEGVAGAKIVQDEAELAEATLQVLKGSNRAMRTWRSAAVVGARRFTGFEANFRQLFTLQGVDPDREHMALWKSIQSALRSHREHRCLAKVVLPKEPEHVVVYVETRHDTAFRESMWNLLAKLGPTWGLHVVHGTENEHYLRSSLINVHNVRYTHLSKLADAAPLAPGEHGAAGEHTPVVDLVAHRAALFKSPRFWGKVAGKASKVLVVEWDVWFPGEPLDASYMEHDWVGPPKCKNLTLGATRAAVGRGAASLRSTKAMAEVGARLAAESSDAEAEGDFWASHMAKEGYGVATVSEAAGFGLERLCGDVEAHDRLFAGFKSFAEGTPVPVALPFALHRPARLYAQMEARFLRAERNVTRGTRDKLQVTFGHMFYHSWDE